MKSKYEEAFEKFNASQSQEEIQKEIEKIIERDFTSCNKLEVLQTLYSCIDLTTLTAKDRKSTVVPFVEGVNERAIQYKGCLPPVAAICVYPAFVHLVKETLKVPSVHIAAVSGGFPASQTLLDVKAVETALTIREGADEIDIVLNVGAFLDGDYEAVVRELHELRSEAKEVLLKVILETGALESPELIQKASILSLFSGADFIKTSTGKEYPGASLVAAYVMAKVLRQYYEAYGERKGLKISGGVSSPEDAVKYYCVAKSILGEEWMTPNLFRIGTSSLEGKLRKAILDQR
mgnify:CR=1 FL=1